MQTATFHWADYLSFISMLVVSAVIGLAFSKKKKQKADESSANDMFTGNRQMTLLPVTMSLFATYMSAVGILGNPAEVFYNGLGYAHSNFSGILKPIFSSFILIPFYYKLGYVSFYEYIRRRFNNTVATLVAFAFQIGMFFYMAVVLYAPASAFSQVSGLSLWISILSVGAICTVYTAFGGIKGVMWTDVWQTLFMFAGLIAIVIIGTIEVGGPEKVIEASRLANRMTLYLDPTPNPFYRHTILSIYFGAGFFFMNGASSQPLYQRYVSCKTLRTAQLAAWLSYFTSVLFSALLCAVGMVAFAYFTCDPLSSGEIKRSEQLVPYMVMKTMRVPGIPGLFLACAFSGSLSTISSGLNSMALVFVVDYVQPIYKRVKQRPLKDASLANWTRATALVIGVMMIGMAFLSDKLGDMIVQITMSIGGMTSGPSLGIMLAANFLPFVNSTGATVGFLVSFLFSVFVGVGSIVTKIGSYKTKLPVSTHGCSVANTTLAFLALNSTSSLNHTFLPDSASASASASDFYTSSMWETTTSASASTFDPTVSTLIDFVNGTAAATATASVSGAGGWTEIFRLSYLLYSATSGMLCLIIAILVSLCTGCNKKTPVDRSLYISCWPSKSESTQNSKRNSISGVDEELAAMKLMDPDANTGKYKNGN